MARLRRDTQETLMPPLNQRPLRVFACGTLFLTHTLSLPAHPEPSTAVRAHSVSKARGGSASTCLSIIAQFPAVEAHLVAPLGGNEDGKSIIRELEQERVSTHFCKVWEDVGVPSAWVLQADDTGTRTVINNNPLPDITHEEFVSLLGPILVPENYAYLGANAASPPQTPNAGPAAASSGQTRTSLSGPSPSSPPVRLTSNSPAPMDWIHFEGRSVKTTLSNMGGLDGLARERKWRSFCVFSIDVGRRARQGVEALIPHADVIFLNRHYARAHSPQYESSPRAFLLSLTSIAPPHALLVAHWGSEGAAVLSVPTREYFQSSGWVDTTVPSAVPSAATSSSTTQPPVPQAGEVQSVRSGSDFWAAGHHTESSGEFTAGQLSSSPDPQSPVVPLVSVHGATAHRRTRVRPVHASSSDSGSSDSDGTQIAGRRPTMGNAAAHANAGAPAGASAGQAPVDDLGTQDAFVAGMIYALSRRMMPGEPYTPSTMAKDGQGITAHGVQADRDRGRWRLEECLRFATELSGRRARKKGWDSLADEMAKAGWFD